MTTFSQWKENILSEAKDIEKKLDRGQNTAENIQRLEAIETMLANVDSIKKGAAK